MIALGTARQLLDFGARLDDEHRAEEQLIGAVALHNMLQRHGVAYLADEVGMGKTFVALGAVALFRHFNPKFRVLIIAPRENIQRKWMKEMRNFVANNVRIRDMRVKDVDGRPARELVFCRTLIDLVRETRFNADRDFFVRMTSFSLAVSGGENIDNEATRAFRKTLLAYLPWLESDALDLRRKQEFKDNYARALCCALPEFDLVIVDEGHNLKHGFAEHSAARNRVMGLAFGRDVSDANRSVFREYGPRIGKLLFLSATPVEESYGHLWNQLDVFGKAGPFDALRNNDILEDDKKSLIGQFLIRRVTSLRVGESELTKNLYRREWRSGGVSVHDEPIHVTDTRTRLTLALVQKKVSELLGHERFNTTFQIGMLASFESFLQTAKLTEDEGNFDDPDQTRDEEARFGIDVRNINELARSYEKTFGKSMPHPKMDALVESLRDSWQVGRKVLIFVRRVASVKELKQKFDATYDEWLIRTLEDRLPSKVRKKFRSIVRRYRKERDAAGGARFTGGQAKNSSNDEEKDAGGLDSFFAWFFRGDGPPGVLSGAALQQRFVQPSSVFSTFFEDNHAARILKCSPDDVLEKMSFLIGFPADQVAHEVGIRASAYLGSQKRITRAAFFDAVQAASMEMLMECTGHVHEEASAVWHELYKARRGSPQTGKVDAPEWLSVRTFYSELRQHPELHARLFPASSSENPHKAFRELYLRQQLLSAAARLGHSLIDFWVLVIKRTRSFQLRVQEMADDGRRETEHSRIRDYLTLLEKQMSTSGSSGSWGAFDELAAIADNFSLLMDVNDPEARSRPLDESVRHFSRLLRAQQPVGGMWGKVNPSLVNQFRMPGYPFLLVTTDLLQEGEDLHTFCSSVFHYGISWTPSSMEQRIGRIDRVRSHTERRLTKLDTTPSGDDLLQVYFPFLNDTIEVLQVRRVLARMNEFLRLMHQGLIFRGNDSGTLNIGNEILRSVQPVPSVTGKLTSAFPVKENDLVGGKKRVVVDATEADHAVKRFKDLANTPLPGLSIAWEMTHKRSLLLGTIKLSGRQQPFSLHLRSIAGHLLVRCISPVGLVDRDNGSHHNHILLQNDSGGICQYETVRANEGFNISVEEDVLLSTKRHDPARIAALIQRVTAKADNLERRLDPKSDNPISSFRTMMEDEDSHAE